MRYNILTFLSIFIISSCSTDNSRKSNDSSDLSSQIEQLKKENALKDSMINESLAFYNEIRFSEE